MSQTKVLSFTRQNRIQQNINKGYRKKTLQPTAAKYGGNIVLQKGKIRMRQTLQISQHQALRRITRGGKAEVFFGEIRANWLLGILSRMTEFHLRVLSLYCFARALESRSQSDRSLPKSDWPKFWVLKFGGPGR